MRRADPTRARRNSRMPVVWGIALVLSACANDDNTTAFIRQNGTWAEPQQLAVASAACTRSGPSVGGFIAGAAMGAAGGFSVGAVAGAAEAGPFGAVAGAGLGFLAGLVGGAADTIPPDDYDFCMARKGYQRVDAATALAPSEPAR
jgi:hypothetical protein